MDLESKISSLKSYVKLSTQDDREATRTNKETSNGNTEAKNGWWGSISDKAQEPDPWLPGLTKTQRIVGFFMCLLVGMFCFGMAAMILPFIIIKSRKFVALYTMGSIFTLGRSKSIGKVSFTTLCVPIIRNKAYSRPVSFSLLWGPYHHFKHLISMDRLPFTVTYFGSMSATLYVAIFMKSTFLTLCCAIIQVMTLIWYIVSYIPGGTAGMKMMSRFFSSAAMKTVSKTLPV